MIYDLYILVYMKLLLPIDDSLVARIDEARGKQPRVSWIRDAIEEKLGDSILAEPMVADKAPPKKLDEAVEVLRGGPVTDVPPPDYHVAKQSLAQLQRQIKKGIK